MQTKKLIKIITLNIGIALFNIFLFSPGLLHLKISTENIMAAAFGITSLFMSGILFILGNYNLLFQKQQIIPIQNIRTSMDYVNALMQHQSKRTFSDKLDSLLEQIQRLQKKKDTIKDILLQKFSPEEMSYLKFFSVVTNIENLFYLNIKSILNKLNAFDEEDYKRVTKQALRSSNNLIQTKLSIYNEYISFIKDSLQDNEEILLKLDRLLLEISKFNSLEDGEIENMSVMQEIDELIRNTKYYK